MINELRGGSFMSSMSRGQRSHLIRIIISFLIFIGLLISSHTDIIPAKYHHSAVMLAAWLVPYLIVGYDVVRKCLLGIFNRQIFDECFLMTLATVGAFGCGEYDEAAAVMLFYQIGEFFQSYAVGRSRNAISELMDIAPDFANREEEDGTVSIIEPDEIKIGDILIIRPGEKIPTDGLILEGEGFINTSALTGEAMPRSVSPGNEVMSGCINGDRLLRVQALRPYDDSTAAQIIELVESASSRKSVTEKFITRFARYYTPAVTGAALLLAFIPPVLSGAFASEFGTWVLRACTFLVISCPCALVISVPLAFFGGIGAASKEGVLVKGSNYLEMMAKLDTVVTDKTGTLTEGRFRVSAIEAAPGCTTEEIIRYAAAAESGSTHPVASAIIEACSRPFPPAKISEIENCPGRGITARVGRDRIAVGNLRLLEELGTAAEDYGAGSTGTACYVVRNGRHIGTVKVADMLKSDAKQSVNDMFAEKVRRVVMLTGDSEESAEAVAGEVGIREYRWGLLPADKVKAVEELLDEISSSVPGGRLAFIGDGINDAPVLSRADVGIAMGSLGSDAAVEAADIVIVDDKLSRIPAVIRIARKTLKISGSNIAFALAVKFLCLVLGALGLADMWAAVFADVGVAVICTLNSMRMLGIRRRAA